MTKRLQSLYDIIFRLAKLPILTAKVRSWLAGNRTLVSEQQYAQLLCRKRRHIATLG
jgi:hypothetical protein